MDFVIPWVDNDDPKWQKQYVKYQKQEGGDKRKTRFRKWDNLQYWFRGVEKFAPWVNKIHFITYGHLPDWLNVSHPKINIVKHSEFIPNKYRPTFNSITIGLNIHRIEDLDEQYVYFNDDVFIINDLEENDFFKNGKPCDVGIANAYTGTPFSFTLLKNMSVINNHFSKKQAIKQNPLNWFNLKYGWENIRTLLLLPWAHTGFYNPHLSQPSLKSTLEMLWNEEYTLLNKACISKFRKYNSVNDYLPRYWELASNNFHPFNMKKFGRYIVLHKVELSEVTNIIEEQSKKVLALNDEKISNFETVKSKIKGSLQKILPQRSQFEICEY